MRAGVARTYVGRVERGVLNPTMVSMTRLLFAIGATWKEYGEELDRELEAANENRAAGRARLRPGPSKR
jgi:transcriptional regulator with XRE-family HTH domain